MIITNLGVAFGEMELSPFTYYGLISIGLIFIICFGLASIPLAKNLRTSKNKEMERKSKN
tara:strand:+ start:159 stop:338 length:180 start_codon:yes stop_codon:yes gene_type:complete